MRGKQESRADVAGKTVGPTTRTRIVKSKSITDMLISQGADPIGSTAGEFKDRIKADLVKWTATIKAAGLRAE